MPLPTPNDGESHGDFINRCMGNPTMVSEYPEAPQRQAICESQWTRSQKGGEPPPPKKDKKDADRRMLITSAAKLKITAMAKADDEGPGWIEGYASVFDVADYGNDIVRKGAFAKTIKERVPAGRVKLMAVHLLHGGGTAEVIGTVTEAKEDDYGLWIHAELSSVALAQDTRQKVLEGHIKELSIGYKIVEAGYITKDEEEFQELKELILIEVTVVPFGMNEHALITAAKAATDLCKIIGQDLETPDEGRLLLGDKGAVKQLKSSLDTLSKQLGEMLKEERPPADDLHRWKKNIDNRLRECESILLLAETEV